MYVLELVGEDDVFARYEAASMASGVRAAAPGIALAAEIDDRARELAYTRRISVFLARSAPTVSAVRSALERCSLTRSGTVAVRAAAIRGSRAETQAVERSLGDVLVRQGYVIDLDDPDEILRVVFAGESAFIGWEEVVTAGAFSDRAPTDRPFFQPGSMAPRLARALVNIAGAEPDTRVLDPMCGTGGVVLEAVLIGATAIGTDAQPRMVRGTRQNCATYCPDGDIQLAVASATDLPFDDDSLDAAVFDLPYERQSPVSGENRDELARAALTEVRRMTDRAIVVADESLNELARACGWRVEAHFARRVHRSLTRHIHDLVEDSDGRL